MSKFEMSFSVGELGLRRAFGTRSERRLSVMLSDEFDTLELLEGDYREAFDSLVEMLLAEFAAGGAERCSVDVCLRAGTLVTGREVIAEWNDGAGEWRWRLESAAEVGEKLLSDWAERFEGY